MPLLVREWVPALGWLPGVPPLWLVRRRSLRFSSLNTRCVLPRRSCSVGGGGGEGRGMLCRRRCQKVLVPVPPNLCVLLIACHPLTLNSRFQAL